MYRQAAESAIFVTKGTLPCDLKGTSGCRNRTARQRCQQGETVSTNRSWICQKIKNKIKQNKTHPTTATNRPVGALERGFHLLPHSRKDRTALPCRGGLSVPPAGDGEVCPTGRGRGGTPAAAPTLAAGPEPRLSPGCWSRPRPGPAASPPITAAHAGCPGRRRGASPSSWRPVNTALIWIFYYYFFFHLCSLCKIRTTCCVLMRQDRCCYSAG